MCRARWPRRPPACISIRALLAALAARGIERACVTLHVGAGTFQPLRSEIAGRATCCTASAIQVGAETVAAIERARARGGAWWRSAPRWRAHSSRQRRPPRRARLAAGAGETHALHPPGLSFPGDRCAADQLSSAAVDAADAGGGVCRPRAACWPPTRTRSRALPLLQLRRCHAGVAAARRRAAPHERRGAAVSRCWHATGAARLGRLSLPHGSSRNPGLHAGRHLRHGQGA